MDDNLQSVDRALRALRANPTDAVADAAAVKAILDALRVVRARRRSVTIDVDDTTLGDTFVRDAPVVARPTPDGNTLSAPQIIVTRDARYALPQFDADGKYTGNALVDASTFSARVSADFANVQYGGVALFVANLAKPYLALMTSNTTALVDEALTAIGGNAEQKIRGLTGIMADVARAIVQRGNGGVRDEFVETLGWLLAKITIGREARGTDDEQQARQQSRNDAIRAQGIDDVNKQIVAFLDETRSTVEQLAGAFGRAFLDFTQNDSANQLLIGKYIPFTTFVLDARVERDFVLAEAYEVLFGEPYKELDYGDPLLSAIFANTGLYEENEFTDEFKNKRNNDKYDQVIVLKNKMAPARVTQDVSTDTLGARASNALQLLRDAMRATPSGRKNPNRRNEYELVLLYLVFMVYYKPLVLGENAPAGSLMNIIGQRPYYDNKNGAKKYVVTAAPVLRRADADLDIIRPSLLDWAKRTADESGVRNVGLVQYAQALLAVTSDKALRDTRKNEGATLIVPRSYNDTGEPEEIEYYVAQTYFVGKRTFDELDEDSGDAKRRVLARADALDDKHTLSTRRTSVLRRRMLSVDGRGEMRVVDVIKLQNARVFVVDSWDLPWSAPYLEAKRNWEQYQALPAARAAERALIEAAASASVERALTTHRDALTSTAYAEALATAAAAGAPTDALAEALGSRTHVVEALHEAREAARLDAMLGTAAAAQQVRTGARTKQTMRRDSPLQYAVETDNFALLERSLRAPSATSYSDMFRAVRSAIHSNNVRALRLLLRTDVLDERDLRALNAYDNVVDDAVDAELFAAIERRQSARMVASRDHDDPAAAGGALGSAFDRALTHGFDVRRWPAFDVYGADTLDTFVRRRAGALSHSSPGIRAFADTMLPLLGELQRSYGNARSSYIVVAPLEAPSPSLDLDDAVRDRIMRPRTPIDVLERGRVLERPLQRETAYVRFERRADGVALLRLDDRAFAVRGTLALRDALVVYVETWCGAATQPLGARAFAKSTVAPQRTGVADSTRGLTEPLPGIDDDVARLGARDERTNVDGLAALTGYDPLVNALVRLDERLAEPNAPEPSDIDAIARDVLDDDAFWQPVRALLERVTLADVRAVTQGNRELPRAEAMFAAMLGRSSVDAADRERVRDLLSAWFARLARDGRIELVRALLDAPPSLVDVAVDDNAPLRQAAARGHVEVVRALLATPNRGIDPAGMDNYALMFAAMDGHADVVRALFAVTEPSADALWGAAINGQRDVVRALLDEPALSLGPRAMIDRRMQSVVDREHFDVARMLLDDDRVVAALDARAVDEYRRAIGDAKRQRTRNAVDALRSTSPPLSSSDDDSDQSLWATLAASRDSMAFADAVRRYNAALVDDLRGATRQVLVFVPVGSAIGKYERELLATEVGAAILDYHVAENVGGLSDDIDALLFTRTRREQSRASDSDGTPLELRVEPGAERGTLRINGQVVRVERIERASNGVAVLIDGVLVPPQLLGDDDASVSAEPPSFTDRLVDMGNDVASDVDRVFSTTSSEKTPTPTSDAFAARIGAAHDTIKEADDGDDMYLALDEAYQWTAANIDAVRARVPNAKFVAALAPLRQTLAERGFATDDSPVAEHLDALEMLYKSV